MTLAEISGVAIMMLLGCVMPATAHSPQQMIDFQAVDFDGGMSGWLGQLQSKKGHCCNGFDGHPPEAAARTTGSYGIGSHYQVRIEHQWVDVPDEAVIKEPNKYGMPVVWYSTVHDGEKTLFNIKCFLPGELY
jgi:hypothetical protein